MNGSSRNIAERSVSSLTQGSSAVAPNHCKRKTDGRILGFGLEVYRIYGARGGWGFVLRLPRVGVTADAAKEEGGG